MIRLIIVKTCCLLFCIPVYPFVLLAEWEDKTSSYGAKFNFKRASAYYWRDVKITLLAKRKAK